MLRTITMLSALLVLAGCSSDSDEAVQSTDSSTTLIPTVPGMAGGGTMMAVPALSGNDLLEMDMGGTSTSADPATAITVTGEEPECKAAFHRVAECFLVREACHPDAASRVEFFGNILSTNSCPNLVDGVTITFETLANVLNAETPCDDPGIAPDVARWDDDLVTSQLCTDQSPTMEECEEKLDIVASCYLTREQCLPEAADRSEFFGDVLAMNSCPGLLADGLPIGASLGLDPEASCDSPGVIDNAATWDMSDGSSGLCTEAALNEAECSSACENVVPCGAGFSDPEAQAAFSDVGSCSESCMGDPLAFAVYPCMGEAATCAAVVECMEGTGEETLPTGP